jgi:hypothetical protein
LPVAFQVPGQDWRFINDHDAQFANKYAADAFNLLERIACKLLYFRCETHWATPTV